MVDINISEIELDGKLKTLQDAIIAFERSGKKDIKSIKLAYQVYTAKRDVLMLALGGSNERNI